MAATLPASPATEIAERELSPTPWQTTRARARRHLGLQLGLGVLLLMALVAVLAPLISPYDPYTQHLLARLLPPVWAHGGQWAHPFGTDQLGRDCLSRLLYGARVSIGIGLGAAAIGALIGVTLGLLAGYFGGRVDQAVSFLLTCQLSMPHLLLIMALVFVFGPSMKVVIGVIGVTHWTYYLVLTRAGTQRIRELDFIAAARAIGSGPLRIMFGEIVPNVLNQIIVIFTLEVAIAILDESALSFLGLGVPDPIASWGKLIAQGREMMFFRPWLVILPGIALFTLVIAINLLGDGIRDVTVADRSR